VPDSHPSLETLARWLAGRLEHDEVLTDIAPHLFDRCPECQAKQGEIQRLLREVGHWDEEIAVIESREAPELFAWLAQHPFEEQLELIEERDEFHAWGLCHLLLKKSQEAVFEEPERAIDYAELAGRIADHLGPVYDVNWILDLRTQIYSHLGNARRVLGELRSAEAAFRKAELCAAKSTTGNGLVLADLLSLKSSLRRAQRRLSEALDLSNGAFRIYSQEEHRQGIAKTLLQRAKLYEETDQLTEAIAILQHAEKEIDSSEQPRTFAYSRFNLIVCLILADRFQEAEQLLDEVRTRFRDVAQPLDLVRLRWVESNVNLGLGRLDEAEAGFRDVQGEFLDRRMGYDAALVSLDLAVLYAQRGATRELKRLAAEVMPAFESREVHREAMAALIMFQNACEEERLTVELARHLAAFLQRERKARAD
jgi:tetratricopeptide (TPR) repeat protein